MCLVWDKPGKSGFIISYFNDYLAWCIQHNFMSLSVQPGDMAVKLGLILPEEGGEKRESQTSEKIGIEWGDAEEKYLNGILQKHLLS